MNIHEKYDRVRQTIKNGDVILFRGNSLLSKAIRWCDKSYYTHIGLVFEKCGRLFVLDSNDKGARPDFLSLRINEYVDFFIISPKYSEREINDAITKLMEKSEQGIKYDFKLLLRIALYRKFKKDGRFAKDTNDSRDICSEFVRRYLKLLGITAYNSLETEWITPQDILRYYDRNTMELKFNDSIL